jgi:hypothetical protein
MKNDKLIRNSREFIEEAVREREKRGLPTAFLSPDSAELSLDNLAAEARRIGRIEGPGLLTPAQTAAAETIRDATDALKWPQQREWIERLLRKNGAKTKQMAVAPNQRNATVHAASKKAAKVG